MSKNKKKRDPFKRFGRWTICMLVLSALCWAVVTGVNLYQSDALEKEQKRVEAENEKSRLAYTELMASKAKTNQTGKSTSWPPAPADGMCLLDLSAYPLENTASRTVTRQELLEGGLMLVNHWHSIPADFSEQNIKSVREWTNSAVPIRDNKIRLFKPAAVAIDNLLIEAGKVNLKDYIVQSAFRTMDEQRVLFDKQAKTIRDKSPNKAESLVIEEAKKSVNYPGTSEYQSGFAFEMKLYNKNDVTITGMRFPDSEQGKYFNEHCWQHGIIFRFPTAGYPLPGTEDKSAITGNSSRLNIYRYVGVAHSTAMKIQNMCLEEYIEYLVQKPHYAIFENGQLKYEVFRQPYGGGDAVIQVPHAATNYTASIDNFGGVVTAFYYD